MLARTTCPIAAIAVTMFCVVPIPAQSTTRVSVSSTGTQGNKTSRLPSISADGHLVAFQSNSDNLVPADTNGLYDVFVRDTQSGQTSRVSVGSGGTQGNGASQAPSISGDGRYVAFESKANNLVPADTNSRYDVFVRDLQTGQTSRVSVSSGGTQGFGDSQTPSISADGRYVAFQSNASDLVVSDSNGAYDIFVRDLQTGQTSRVSVDSSGAQANSDSQLPSISADGRYVAFESNASNLVPGDTNAIYDIFLRDTLTGQTTRVSVATAGTQGNGGSYTPSISADGLHVVFDSDAANLAPGDTNGVADVFMHDMQSAQTKRVSLSSFGTQTIFYDSYAGSVNADGRIATFLSYATNLVAGDTNGHPDVFVRDMQMGQTTRVSVTSGGLESNSTSFSSSISATGQIVAFDSNANNLVAGDTNNDTDVFVRDWPVTCWFDNDLDGFGAGSPVTYYSAGCGLGYAPNGLDCDDTRATVYPGAPELCDGLDNDCNSQVDDGLIFVTYYIDVDGDGYGNASVFTSACTQPNGYAANGADCDDTRASVHPGAPELCNGDDDDCNGQVDDGLTFSLYYVDLDGDGFGNPNAYMSACAQPNGYVTNSADCDDSRTTVHPGAPELCNGIDDNCDGIVDNGYLTTYCTAGTTSHGCAPWISGAGAPSSTSSTGFNIVVHAVEGLRMGLIFYGSYAAAVPWAAGSFSYRCIANPSQRTDPTNSGGTLGHCDGELSVDFNAWMAANPFGLGYPFVQGQVFYAQGWFRDPSAPKGTNLSDGLRFTLCN